MTYVDMEYGNKKTAIEKEIGETEDYSKRFELKHEIERIDKEHASMKNLSGVIGAQLSAYCERISTTSNSWALRDFAKEFTASINASSDIPEYAKKYFAGQIAKNVNDDSIRRFAGKYDNINPIGRMGVLANFGIDEVGEKTEMLSVFLGIDEIDNPEARDFSKASIQKYIGAIPYGKFFKWDDFEKSFRASVTDETVGITGIVRESLLSKLNIQRNYRSLLNAETDFVESLESMRLGILDIASISKDDEKNRKYQFLFFNLLYLYIRLVRPGKGDVNYVFFEEFHNYLDN